MVGLVTIPVNTVLAGGVLCRFRDPGSQFSLVGFCRDAGRYGWRLIRLMILGLLCYWIVFLVVYRGLGGLISSQTHDWQDDRAVFALQLGVGLLLLIGLCFVNLIMDFARVKLVLEEGSSAAEAFLASLGFSLRRQPHAITVYALPTLAGLALLGLYWLVVPWSFVNAPCGEGTWAQYREPLTVALLFIGQQVVMFGRYWFRVATWASQWAFYSGSR